MRIGSVILLLALAGPVQAERFFGYVAVACGHDDPFDASTKSDYADEVAGFTNANHVCLPGDPALWADTLARTAAQFDPVVTVEVLFDFTGAGPDGPAARALWALFTQALADSGVSPERLFFYLADEPTLRGISVDMINRAGQIVHDTYPGGRTMLVEAFRMEGPTAIAESVDYWGFDAYTLRDPGAERLYTTFLDLARRRMGPHQKLFLVLDAQHTPVHAQAGLTADDMADVARATLAFAQLQPDVVGMLGYTWAGGIDNLEERGVRDLPESVIAAHREVGRAFLAGE